MRGVARGVPRRSVIKWCFEPDRPRSVGFGPVFAPPLFAGVCDESITARDQSSFPARWSLTSRTSSTWSNTRARCHSRRRFQQVIPLQPNSAGTYSQGMPVRKTNTMPVRAALSGARGRPPHSLGVCLGRTGSKTVQSSSSTSSRAMLAPGEKRAEVPGAAAQAARSTVFLGALSHVPRVNIQAPPSTTVTGCLAGLARGAPRSFASCNVGQPPMSSLSRASAQRGPRERRPRKRADHPVEQLDEPASADCRWVRSWPQRALRHEAHSTSKPCHKALISGPRVTIMDNCPALPTSELRATLRLDSASGTGAGAGPVGPGRGARRGPRRLSAGHVSR
jgi:hypothetical protein